MLKHLCILCFLARLFAYILITSIRLSDYDCTINFIVLIQAHSHSCIYQLKCSCNNLLLPRAIRVQTCCASPPHTPPMFSKCSGIKGFTARLCGWIWLSPHGMLQSLCKLSCPSCLLLLSTWSLLLLVLLFIIPVLAHWIKQGNQRLGWVFRICWDSNGSRQ